jgi:hypothetical protein
VLPLFLCKVAEYVDDSADQVFKEWETEDGRSQFQERNRNESASRPWQTLSRPMYQPHQGGNQVVRDDLRAGDAERYTNLRYHPHLLHLLP